MQWKHTVLLFLLPILFACANTTRQAASPPPAADRVITVASVLGDEINVQHVGPTIFHSNTFTIDVPEWAMDSHVATHTRSVLSDNGYQVRDVPDELKRTLRLNENPSMLEQVTTTHVTANAAELRSMGKATQADELVLVAPGSTGDRFFDASVSVKGVGVYQRQRAPFMGESYMAVEQTTLSVRRYDLTTGERIDDYTCSIADARKSKHWLESPADLTDEHRPKLRQDLFDLLDTCVSLSLHELNLNRHKPTVPEYDDRDARIVKNNPETEIIRIPEDADSISHMAVTCNKPHEFTQDCSIWSRATREVELGGTTLEAAATEDGTAIIIEAPGIMKDTHGLSRGMTDFLAMMEKADIDIRTVRPITALNIQHGYLIELDGDGYSVLTSRAAASR